MHADWAGDVNDRKSTSDYLFMMSGAPVSWKSKKQISAEAEYVALACATQEVTCWENYSKISTMNKLNQLLFMKITKQPYE